MVKDGISANTGAANLGEESLVAGLQRGDEAAFAQVMRQYGGRLLTVARRLCRDDHEAQDAFQDAMLLAYRKIAQFDGRSKLSTWLHRVTVNAALMRLRKRARRGEEVNVEPLLPQFTDAGWHARPPKAWAGYAPEALEREETRQIVRDAIDRLPDNYRIVLLLRDIEEMETEEVAEMLELTTNNVKVRLHRARMALRELLSPHFEESTE